MVIVFDFSDNSAHSPNFEETDKFLEIILEILDRNEKQYIDIFNIIKSQKLEDD